MRYIIQIFRHTQEDGIDGEWPKVGSWHNTAWGSDDKDKALANAESVMATGKYAGVRVLELLFEKMQA